MKLLVRIFCFVWLFFILESPHDIAILANATGDFSFTGQQLYEKLRQCQILDGSKPFIQTIEKGKKISKVRFFTKVHFEFGSRSF